MLTLDGSQGECGGQVLRTALAMALVTRTPFRIEEAQRYLAAGVPVGEHLADQLLLPMVIAGGGAFLTLPLSGHALTNIDVIRRFCNVKFEVEETERGNAIVRITS